MNIFIDLFKGIVFLAIFTAISVFFFTISLFSYLPVLPTIPFVSTLPYFAQFTTYGIALAATWVIVKLGFHSISKTKVTARG